MAIKGANKSDKKVIKSRVLYTGLANFKIVAFNPDEKEREELDITQKVSDYTGTDDKDNPQIRLDLWLQLVGLPYQVEGLNVKEVKENFPLQKLSIFLTDKELESSAKNKMWINRIGQTNWQTAEVIDANPAMKWFDTTDMRLAIQGEEQLTKFLIAFLNLDVREEGAECRLDDPKKIATGKDREFRNILTGWKNNTVQLLVMVKKVVDGEKISYFQDFYKEFFGRPSVKTIDAWQKAIGDDRNGLGATRYSNFKLGVGGLEFCEYQTSTQVLGSGQDSSADDQGTDSSGPSDNPEDDPPF